MRMISCSVGREVQTSCPNLKSQLCKDWEDWAVGVGIGEELGSPEGPVSDPESWKAGIELCHSTCAVQGPWRAPNSMPLLK